MRITKRLGALAIALVLVLSMLPASTFAADWGYVGKIGNGFEWNYDSSSGVLTISNYKGGGPMVDCGKLVNSIKYSFYARNVVIEEGITSIGAGFFDGCYSMESVTLPSTITQIGSNAFNGCSALKEITIPSSVTYIASSTFYSCRALTSVVVPEGVTELGKFAFANCSKLTEISLPSTLVKIDNAAFEGCSSLPRIEFPASVTEVGRAAFNGCTALTELKVPDTMTEIGDNFLDGCNNLTEFEIPAGVTRIGNYAFRNCSGLTELVIPEGVTQIGDSAFEGCTGLREVVLPDSVESIGKTAFKNTRLTSVELPANLKTIGEEAFIDCTALKYVTLPEGLKTIDKYAFQRCPLESIVIPSTVTSMGTGVFSGCKQLKNVQILAGVSELSTGMFNSCPIEEIVIPEGVVTIWNDTFYGCKNLKTVTIPESVKSINYQAFRNAATKLTVRCYEGSYAETWAQTNGHTIEYLKDDVQSIEIVQMPERTQFAVGETLDLSGMKIKVTMGDGTTKILNTGYTLEQKTMADGGPMWVTVNYRDVSTRLLVTPSTNEGKHFSVSFTRPCVYTPSGCSPSPIVMSDGKELNIYVDYDLTYSNNKVAGEQGMVTVTGRGDYKGIVENFNYMILPGNIADCSISCGTAYYTGQPVRPISVEDGSTILKENVDYRVEYSGNVALGKASYVIIGIGNYTGSYSGNFTIQKKPESSSKTVSLPASSTSVVTGLYLRFEIEALVQSYEIYKTGTGAYVSSGSARPSASSTKASFGYIFSEPGSYTLEYKYSGYRVIYQSNGTVRYEPTGTTKSGTVRITVTAPGSSSETEEWPNAAEMHAGSITELDERTRMLYLVFTPENTNPGVITWTSSDPDVATVNGGRVHFLKPGAVVITAESSLGMQLTFNVSADAIDLTDGGRIVGYSANSINPWSVYYGDIPLKEGVDFTATKTEEDGLLTYQVTGIGMYTGTITKQLNANMSELPCVHEMLTRTEAATCLQGGYTVEECIHCNYTEVVATTAKLEHTWDEGVVTTEPTEDAEGAKLYTCTVCGETKEEVLPKIEHIHNYIPEVTPATCVTDGYTTYTCACGDSYQADVVPALGHDYDLWQIDTEPVGGYGIGTMHRDCANGHTEYAEYNFTLTDVPNGKYFSKPVYWAFVNGITKGKTTTQFQRDAECTRKQIVMFLWRTAGQPEPQSMVNPFDDVKRGDQFEKAILWAYYEGITSGKTATQFQPEAPCTREQIVMFLWRYFGKPEPQSMVNPFTDVKIGGTFEKAILWAYYEGITTGKTATTFEPQATCTRGQIVTFLYRAVVK